MGRLGWMKDSEHFTGSLHMGAGHADHVYSVAKGATPPPGIEEISSSWQRSANEYGVDPDDSKAPRILTPGELKNIRGPLEKLIFTAQEELDQLYKVVREAGYTVLLCDSSGVAVEHRGDQAQASRFEYWGTWLGGVRGGGGHERHRHLHRRGATRHRSQKPAL
jgi:transcriptional regulator of acetoin/glycerol metabolism